MEVEFLKQKLNVGDLVEIDKEVYIVNSLIGCVEWDWKQGECYLHRLSGSGFYSYPTTLDNLMAKIKNDNGRVYSKDHFKLNIVAK